MQKYTKYGRGGVIDYTWGLKPFENYSKPRRNYLNPFKTISKSVKTTSKPPNPNQNYPKINQNHRFSLIFNVFNDFHLFSIKSGPPPSG